MRFTFDATMPEVIGTVAQLQLSVEEQDDQGAGGSSVALWASGGYNAVH